VAKAGFWEEMEFSEEIVLQVGMAFRMEMVSDLLPDVCVRLGEEHLYLCSSTMSGDSSLCHFGKEDSRLCGCDES
jgi:hypothetical protein